MDLMTICEYLLRKEDGKKISIQFKKYVANPEKHMEGAEV
jgi:hypothetical protein